MWTPYRRIAAKIWRFDIWPRKNTSKVKESTIAKLKNRKAINWRQDEKNDPSHVLIGHSVWRVGLLEKADKQTNKHNTWFQCYSLCGLLQKGLPLFFDSARLKRISYSIDVPVSHKLWRLVETTGCSWAYRWGRAKQKLFLHRVVGLDPSRFVNQISPKIPGHTLLYCIVL